MNSSATRWTGIFPPIVTPLLDVDTLDVEGLERLISHVLDGGVHGLFVLGTTGEAPSLSYRLRRELIARTCSLVNGRAPVLVGVTDTAFVETVQLAKWAAEHGASALVLSAPYYFPAGQPELQEYLAHILPKLPLPVFLYNMPSHTKITFELPTIEKALEIPGIVGLKDSSGSMLYFHQVQRLVRDRANWSLLVGPEELLAESLLLGGNGGICGGANLCPRLYVELHNAACRGDLPRVATLHRLVLDLSSTLYQVGQHRSAIIKGLKSALSLLGICSDYMEEPFHRFREQEKVRVEACLENLGISAQHPLPRGM